MIEGKKSSELNEIKRELTTRKIELEQDLVQSSSEKFSDDQVQDPGDQALTSTMESLRSSIQDTRIDELNRIAKALKMIEEGTYGICVDCELPISERRLKLYPDATRCLACQEAFEEGKGVEE
ncbi:molecular chaperone DnaK suppressor DksA [soil metagenome]